MSKYTIVESVGRGIQQVHDYGGLERHHPSRGNERGRVYATVNGEREEVLSNYRGTPATSSDGDYFVSKDFVLKVGDSSSVSVPSVAKGYIGHIDPSDGIVQIYDRPASDPDREMIVQYRHLDLRNTTLKIGDHIEYGQSVGIQAGFNNGKSDAFGKHVHIDINTGYLPQMDRYIRDIDNGVITTDRRPGRQENLVAAGQVTDVSAKGSILQAPTRAEHARTQQPVLKLDSEGPDVRSLQTTLRGLGYTGTRGEPLLVDGDFGSNTDEAVRDFQRAHGLEPVDGKVGPDTRTALAQAAQRPLVSESTHPNHGLYAAIGAQLPSGTDPKVIANVTLQAMENGITSEQKLERMAVSGTDAYLMGVIPGDRVKVDLVAPTPGLQTISDHLREQTQQQVQQQRSQSQAMSI